MQCDGPLLADSTLSTSPPIAAGGRQKMNQTPINTKDPAMETQDHPHREAWNKGKLVGQKAPLKPKEIWAIRIQLQNAHAVRDVTHGNRTLSRTIVVQRKAQRPVQFELTEPTRTAVVAWIAKVGLKSEDFLSPSRLNESPHVSTRQYARTVEHWVVGVGLDPSAYRTPCGARREH